MTLLPSANMKRDFVIGLWWVYTGFSRSSGECSTYVYVYTYVCIYIYILGLQLGRLQVKPCVICGLLGRF